MSGSTMFWRLMWKEYRQFRAFAFWLLVVGFIFVLIGASLGKLNDSYQSMAATMALLFPTLFVAGCAATSLAMEHESKTYLLQRMLPVSVWQVFSAKIIWTLAWAAVIFMILSVAAVLFGGITQTNFEAPTALSYGLVLLEIFALGTLFSLIDHRPLRALVLTVVAEFLLVGLASWISLGVHGGHSNTPAIDPAGLCVRVTSLIALAFADLWLAKRWFLEGSNSTWLRNAISPILLRPKLHASTQTLSGSAGMFSHLLWLQARISIWLMLLIGFVTFVFGLIVVANSAQTVSIPLVRYAFVIGCTVIGGLTFHAAREQRNFLAQHGVRSFWLWSSQIIVPALICSLFLLLLWLWLPRQYDIDWTLIETPNGWKWLTHEYFTGWRSTTTVLILTAFSYSQWGSQISRSSLSAIGAAAILALLAIGWVGFMEHLEVSRWLSVYPFILIPIVFTLLNTRRWLVGARGTVIGKCAAAIPFIAIFVVVVLFRMFEIPAVDQQELARLFPVREPRNPAMVTQFRQLGDALMANSRNWEGSEYKRLQETALAACVYQRTIVLHNEFDFELSELPDLEVGDLRRQTAIGNSLIGSLNEAIDAGQVKEGERILMAIIAEPRVVHSLRPPNFFDLRPSLLRWASLPGNTSEKVLNLVERLQRQDERHTDDTQGDGLRWRLLKAALHGDPDALNYENPYIFNPQSLQVKLYLWMETFAFWERIRQERLLDQQTIQGVEGSRYLANCLQTQVPFTRCLSEMPTFPFGRYQFVFDPPPRKDIDAAFYWVAAYYADEAETRQFLIQLAMKAWQIDHGGDLPEELEQLAGKYLGQIPKDPFTGQSFYYFPQGIEFADPNDGTVIYSGMLQGESNERTKPFLWSPGWYAVDSKTPFIGLFDPGTTRSDLTWEHIFRGKIYVIEPIDSDD